MRRGVVLADVEEGGEEELLTRAVALVGVQESDSCKILVASIFIFFFFTVRRERKIEERPKF